MYLQGHGYAPTFTVTFPDGQSRTSTVQWRPDNPATLLSSGVARIDPPAGSYPDPRERRTQQIAIQGLLAPTAQLDGTLLSSSFPRSTPPPWPSTSIAATLASTPVGRSRCIAWIPAHRPTPAHQGETGEPGRRRASRHRPRHRGALRRRRAVHQPAGLPRPGQVWVLVFAAAMMAGLLVSLLVRRRRVWIRVTPAGPVPSASRSAAWPAPTTRAGATSSSG
ncbi:resB-like family protein [Mycobacterium xenopi 3993]|nr:resB-like family protein [Mycobacterium xenopi 3993]